MIINLPKKSFLGFKILTSKQSICFAYFFILTQYFLVPQFGNKTINLISGSLFLLISNLSIIVLTLNSFLQKDKKLLNYWILFNIPLWILFPIQLSIIYKSLITLARNIF